MRVILSSALAAPVLLIIVRLAEEFLAELLFKKITQQAVLDGNWHPHEARHAFVSILSENDVKIQAIADAVGPKNTRVTESVYRHVIGPEIPRRCRRHVPDPRPVTPTRLGRLNR